MSSNPEKSPRQPLSPEERKQIKDLVQMLGIIILFVIVAAVGMGIVVTLLQ